VILDASRNKQLLAPGQWASSSAPSFMLAAVLALMWSSRRRTRACSWRVTPSTGSRQRNRWPSVRRSSASLSLSPGSDLAPAAPHRGRVA
jgi:hypothetical protein